MPRPPKRHIDPIQSQITYPLKTPPSCHLTPSPMQRHGEHPQNASYTPLTPPPAHSTTHPEPTIHLPRQTRVGVGVGVGVGPCCNAQKRTPAASGPTRNGAYSWAMELLYREDGIEVIKADGILYVYETTQINKKKSPLEHDEQVVLVNKLRRAKIAHHSIPNGGARSARSTALLKREGLSAGVPDLYVVDHPQAPPQLLVGYPMAIELKRANGDLTDVAPRQRKWLKRLDSNGWVAVVCFGHRAALAALKLAGYTV